MMICKDCYIPMASIMSFSKDRHEKFCRCKKCYSESRHQKLDEKKLDFREELSKALHKRK